jgi:alpha-glucosidase
MRAVVDAYPDRLLIGEMSYGSPIESLVSFVADAGIDLPTNFSLITLPFAPEHIAEHVDAYDAAVVAGGAWPNYCVSNHDMPRVSAHGPRRARLALLLLLTLRGTPFVYYGDEIGMANVEVPPEQRDDRWAVPQHGMTRDSVRTPMQWDGGPNAGFCPPDVTPWLPVAGDHQQVNVAAQRGDDTSLLHLVRRLLTLRRGTPPLLIGRYRRLADAPPHSLAFVREHDGHEVAVVLNFAEQPATVDLACGSARVLLDTGFAATVEGAAVTVPPAAGVVLEMA